MKKNKIELDDVEVGYLIQACNTAIGYYAELAESPQPYSPDARRDFDKRAMTFKGLSYKLTKVLLQEDSDNV